MQKIRTATGTLMALLIARTAWAASPIPQPPVDLGATSFLDGEAGPGFLLEIIGNAYSAALVTDAAGRPLPGNNGQSGDSLILHTAYVSNVPVFGGHLGFEVLLPFAFIDLTVAGAPQMTQGGVGDVTVAPFVQWSGLHLFDRDFSMRIGLQGVVPAGSYSTGRALNIGQDVWQISPYYAFTWRVTQRWEISGRLIYDWSSANTNPPAVSGALSVQPGDQFATDLSASYALSEHWRLGVASYMLQQLSDSRINDLPVPGSRQRAFGLGPGALWTNGHVTLIGNVYREFATANRPEGFSGFLRLLPPLNAADPRCLSISCINRCRAQQNWGLSIGKRHG
jgi:hypothetical protein